ncbi:Hypothetical predicted protein [Octopus vulgaris]|uniref:Secreted protein n=1 Tax=Octopus vulgaris TaxID=6645 RepID=A0AA36ATY1_OCTVU|nr:Hypothetical predicted protein [Octopus vulgaris]
MKLMLILGLSAAVLPLHYSSLICSVDLSRKFWNNICCYLKNSLINKKKKKKKKKSAYREKILLSNYLCLNMLPNFNPVVRQQIFFVCCFILFCHFLNQQSVWYVENLAENSTALEFSY